MAAKKENNKELNPFELAIKSYLDKRAESDELFAKAYAKESKSIERCCLYIIGEAQKNAFDTKKGKVAAIPDDEVYGMAVHYYDEDDMEIDRIPEEKIAEVKKAVDEQIKVGVPFKSGGVGMEMSLF